MERAIRSQFIENILDFMITSQKDKHTTDHHRYYKVQWKPTWVSEACLHQYCGELINNYWLTRKKENQQPTTEKLKRCNKKKKGGRQTTSMTSSMEQVENDGKTNTADKVRSTKLNIAAPNVVPRNVAPPVVPHRDVVRHKDVVRLEDGGELCVIMSHAMDKFSTDITIKEEEIEIDIMALSDTPYNNDVIHNNSEVVQNIDNIEMRHNSNIVQGSEHSSKLNDDATQKIYVVHPNNDYENQNNVVYFQNVENLSQTKDDNSKNNNEFDVINNKDSPRQPTIVIGNQNKRNGKVERPTKHIPCKRKSSYTAIQRKISNPKEIMIKQIRKVNDDSNKNILTKVNKPNDSTLSNCVAFKFFNPLISDFTASVEQPNTNNATQLTKLMVHPMLPALRPISNIPSSNDNMTSNVPSSNNNTMSNVPISNDNITSNVPLSNDNIISPLSNDTTISNVPLVNDSTTSNVPLGNDNLISSVSNNMKVPCNNNMQKKETQIICRLEKSLFYQCFNCLQNISDSPFDVHIAKCRQQKQQVQMQLTKSKSRRPILQCEQCDYRGLKKNLKQHTLTHSNERPFKCDQCNYRARTLMYSKQHALIHSNERPFKCDQCDYRARSSTTLAHHKIIHRSEKRHKCSECSYATHRYEHIKLHMLQHTGERPYACDQCDYKSRDPSTLRGHKNRHKEKKDLKFHCDVCDYSTGRRRHLELHMVKHSTECNFKCDHCPSMFKHKDFLRNHTKRMHQGLTSNTVNNETKLKQVCALKKSLKERDMTLEDQCSVENETLNEEISVENETSNEEISVENETLNEEISAE